MSAPRAYPGLDQFDALQRQTIRLLWDRIHAIEDGHAWRGDQDAAGHQIQHLGLAQTATEALSQAAGDARYGATAIRSALQAGGLAPLFVGGLRGILADAQPMGITVIASTEPALPSTDLYVAYQVVLWNSTLYYVDPSTNPYTWTTLVVGGLTIDTGTLNPDTKPSLGTGDAGYIFAASDYNRLYRWTGTVWRDVPGTEPRGIIVWSYEPTSMMNGWEDCDGGITEMSTYDGQVVAYTKPDLITGNAFIRAAAAEGGTGAIAAGAGENYFELIPYIRL